MQCLSRSGGRGKLLNNEQEKAIVAMVVANNELKLREIQASQEMFENINSISQTTITRTLAKHRVCMKQLYTVDITICAAIAYTGLLRHRSQVGPDNTAFLAFLNDLHQLLVPQEDDEGDRTFVVTWDRVVFHHSQVVTAWFRDHPKLLPLFLPPYSPFLNPIEDFFPAWRWKAFDHKPHDQITLLDAMDAGCRDIAVEDCQGWIRHSKHFFPRCIALEDIRCHVDENMWPNSDDRRD